MSAPATFQDFYESIEKKFVKMLKKFKIKTILRCKVLLQWMNEQSLNDFQGRKKKSRISELCKKSLR